MSRPSTRARLPVPAPPTISSPIRRRRADGFSTSLSQAIAIVVGGEWVVVSPLKDFVHSRPDGPFQTAIRKWRLVSQGPLRYGRSLLPLGGLLIGDTSYKYLLGCRVTRLGYQNGSPTAHQNFGGFGWNRRRRSRIRFTDHWSANVDIRHTFRTGNSPRPATRSPEQHPGNIASPARIFGLTFRSTNENNIRLGINYHIARRKRRSWPPCAEGPTARSSPSLRRRRTRPSSAASITAY